MKTRGMPFFMGAAMGLMMLWMLHGQLTGDSAQSGVALTVFVGAHVLAAGAVIAGGVYAARLSPALRRRLARLHRPSWRHLLLMLAGAAMSAGAAHIWIHWMR